jgi:shikimate kinase
MGSGKTTAGRKVAKLLGEPFVDADIAIEAATGRTVAEWFQRGEPAFREAETRLLAAILGGPDPVVLGAGGGVVVSQANRERLAQDDVCVVYLHAEPAFLASRASAKPHRPLLAGDPREVLTDLYAERDAWYREVADAVVEVRPAHEAGERPKWRLAEQVVEALVSLGVRPPMSADAIAIVEAEAVS